jgi:hypothetical protein
MVGAFIYFLTAKLVFAKINNKPTSLKISQRRKKNFKRLSQQHITFFSVLTVIVLKKIQKWRYSSQNHKLLKNFVEFLSNLPIQG